MRTRRVFLVLLTAFLTWAGVLNAQTTGAIEGTVYDPSGASLEGASLQIVETQTGAARAVRSSENGYYVGLHLAPGSYEIRIFQAGFREQVRRGVTLSAGRTIRVDFFLELGEQREQVVVVAEAPPVSTSVADWGGLIEQDQLASLPLNGRDVFELAAQQGGATIPLVADRGLTSGQGTQISINGSRPNMNSFQIDGIYVNDATGSMPSSAAGALLGLESIREVQVVANPFSSEYGRTAGGVFTAVSKSGSNLFHGSLFEYFRNSALDAKNYFDLPGQTIPPLRRNQFGGMIGGPVHRDKVFFLLNYEGVRESLSTTVRPGVPTADARQGLLPDAAGARKVEVAPEVRPYLELYPLPNGRDFGDGTAEFVNESARKTDEDYVSGKVDVLFSPRTRLASRYTFDAAESGAPDPMRIWTFALESRYQFVNADLRRIHSPNTISNLRAAFSRVRNAETSKTRDDIPAELSFVPGQSLGSIQVVGLTELGGIRARLRPRQFVVNNYQFNGDVVHVRGRHTFRLGAGFDRVQFNQIADLSAVGHYQFNSLEDFLLNRTRNGEVMGIGSDTVRGWRFNQFFGYFQDEFRATPKLSLSLGVRYETASTPAEVNGKLASLHDPLRDAAVTVGGPLFRNPSKRNFAPRASIAWDPSGSGETVIRAGGGIFFDLLGTRELVVAGVRMPPFFQRLVLVRPQFPDILRAAEEATPPNSLDGLEFAVSQPYVARWQLTIERQVASDVVARLGYSGTRGVHLPGQFGNINPTRPEISEDGRVFFPADAPRLNPAFVQVGMRSMAFNSVYHALSAGLEGRWGSRLRFQTKYTFGKSIDETSSTIFGDFDNSDLIPTMFNFKQNRGRSDFDLRHVFAANFSYQISKSGDTVASKILGGWEIHGLTQIQSGHPFTPNVGFDRARLRPGRGDLGQRPDLAAASGGDIILGDPQRWFDPLSFDLPEAGFYGNLGRGTLTGPGLFNLNLAVHKILWRNERHALRLRSEFFNATNHPNFQIPSGRALFNSRLLRLGAAGRITETSTTSRQIQLALRWDF